MCYCLFFPPSALYMIVVAASGSCYCFIVPLLLPLFLSLFCTLLYYWVDIVVRNKDQHKTHNKFLFYKPLAIGGVSPLKLISKRLNIIWTSTNM